MISDQLSSLSASAAVLPQVGGSSALTDPLTASAIPLVTRSSNSNIVFIDPSVTNYSSLVNGVNAGTDVYVLNPAQDAIAQITNTLLGRSGIASVHILSHGSSSSVTLGNTVLNATTLSGYASQIRSWGNALTTNADILFYGCDIANDPALYSRPVPDAPMPFLQQLASLTGADIAASNDLTGSAALGGDWVLEYQSGPIEAGLAFQAATLATYDGILPTLAIGANAGGAVGSTPIVVAPNLTITPLAGEGPLNQGTTRNEAAARVIITDNFNAATDSLAIQGQTGASGTVAVNGTTLNWTYNSATGILRLSGSTSVADYQAALRQVTFSTTATTGPSRTVRFILGDLLSFQVNGQNRFYEFVPYDANTTDRTWTTANTNSGQRYFNALQGYLATITSQAEQDNIAQRVTGNGWIGASDAAVEGEWRWVAGPEAGTLFWQGNGTNAAGPVNSLYNNWSRGASAGQDEPNNGVLRNGDVVVGGNGEDYGHIIGNAGAGILYGWNDLPDPGASGDFQPLGYIVEYGGLSTDSPIQITGNAIITLGAQAPVVTLARSTFNYLENGRPVRLDQFAQLTDSDSANLNSGFLRVAVTGGNTVDDRLVFQNTTTLSYNNTTNVLTYQGQTIGQGTGFGTTAFQINFNSNTVTPAIAQLVLRQIQYANPSNPSNPGTRTLSITVNDGDGNTSTPVSQQVIVGSQSSGVPGDLNGDGNPDIIWRNPATGQNLTWLLNGVTFSSEVALPTRTGNWKIAATLDADGDGDMDIIWREQSTGDNRLWVMDGVSLSTELALPRLGGQWRIAGNADLDNDGVAEVVLRNTQNGQVLMWDLSVTRGAASVRSLVLGSRGLNFTIAGIGDFNKDGQSDILWYNSQGSLQVWQLGATPTGRFQITNLVASITVPSNLQIQAVGDTDGDGDADIVLRDSQGIVYLWKARGANNVKLNISTQLLRSVASVWTVVGASDFDNDGDMDILWRNVSGTNSIWQLGPQGIQSRLGLRSIPTNWRAEAPDTNVVPGDILS